MRKIISISLISCLVISISTISNAQPGNPSNSDSPDPKYDVLLVINELFDGYREGDSSRVSKTFEKGAIMQRIANKEGKTIVTPSNSVQGWLNYIGSGLKEIHDEPLWDTVVQIDGDLASVWTKYAFYLGGKFHHCGVDNFLLHRTDAGWKIFHIVDTSQEVGCNIPDAVRQKSENK